MSLLGVYSRMHDGERWKPFLNQAQIEISEAGITYSTRPMGGERRRQELPIQWQGENAFLVDWRPVCRRWCRAAIFRAHVDNGVPGLIEQGRHFWRYEGAAGQSVERGRGSHEAGAPNSRPVGSRPTGASTPQEVVATAQSAAVASSSQRTAAYHTCLASFDPTTYGGEYMKLTQGDMIEELDESMASEGWAYGRVVLPEGGLSKPGWYPQNHVAAQRPAA